MNPNKKDNSGWILCPSKSFPGKFYYFNVLNGATAWSLNDTDQKAIRKDNILQKADKTHTFPEPSGPPAESPSTNIELNMQKQAPIIIRRNDFPQTTPVFGQATFPTYISNVNPYMQNIIWAPMLPMFPKPWQDQRTPSWESREVLVETCNIPLSKRFTNYEEPKTNMFQQAARCPQFFGQSSQNEQPLKTSSNITTESQIFGVNIKNTFDPIKKGRQRTQSESNRTTFYDNIEPLKKVGRQRTLSDDSVIFEKYDESKSAFNQSLKIYKQNIESSDIIQPRSNFVMRKSLLYPNTSETINNGHTEINEKDPFVSNLEKYDQIENNKGDFLGNLDKNDLRHTLVRKRRISICLGRTNHVDENQYMTLQTPVKKRVMFDLDSAEGSSKDQDSSENLPPITIDTMRDLAERYNGYWYIVVDSGVLLDNYDFIDKFVKLDKECRLFVPYAVRSEIEEYSFGDCRGQQRVIVARQLTRKLATLQHVVVQPAEDEDKIYTNMSTIVRILNCCKESMKRNDHVVLITEDTILYEKAKTLKIHCFKLKDVKDGVDKSDQQSLKITLKNESTQNLFLPKESSFYSNTNSKIPIDGYKKTIFDDDAVKKNCDVQTHIKVTTDANTSPINFEETIVKKKEKSRDYLNFNYDSDSDATVISKTMEKLIIKDKNSNFLNKNSNDIVKLDDRKKLFTFQIKNKNPQNEQKSGHLQNSKKESVFSAPKQNLFLIQNQKVSGQNEIQSIRTDNLKEKFKKSIGDKVKQRFQVKSKFMVDNIRSNIDEWICTFRQIMEYGLSSYLQKNSSEIPLCLLPPWTLHEAVTCVRKVVDARGVWKVTVVADELSLLLLNNCCKRGELKKDIKPEKLMCVFGCGVLLVELLQSTVTSQALSDTQQLLYDMLHRIQHGSEEVDLIRTPVLRREYGDEPNRHNFPKKKIDIIQYLKNHFPAWQSYVESSTHDEVITQNDKKIVRTFGRNLNLLTIDNTKSMTLKESPDNAGEVKETKLSRQSSEVNLSENTQIHSQSTIKLNEPKIIRLFDTNMPLAKKNSHAIDISMTPKHGNTFDDIKETDGPKVVRNMNPIEEFENKLQSKNDEIDFNINACDLSLSDISLCTSVDRINEKYHTIDDVKKAFNDDENCELNNSMEIRRDSINDRNSFNSLSLNDNKEYRDQNNDIDKPNDSSTSDSGFVNENNTYTLVQTFLSELSGSMKSIYGFIDDSMAEFRKKEIESDKKRSIFDKASVSHLHLSGIIYKLKCIVQRESDEVTPLKEILLKADMMVLGDIRLMKYRQVVMKCLEQAQLLEAALKILLAITEGNYDVAYCTDRQTFLNIFE
ncbi:uncharacterized protein LOC128681879 isoform X2 [Plodia interpunctella]|uniref:uncharacterized protein LOC128681879 isoform X2 n=1 Tax=Plodia interpunctella TaxID=58824 RepID=UPI0023687FDD|nr:uncharacterized protein LOC128681879 isoform X2 [Plodia interpunctella]